MSRKTSTPKPAKRVTKSIRLTTEEADDLAQLVTGTAYAEAALLRQWVLAGMQQFRVVEAIRLYQDGHVYIPRLPRVHVSPSPSCWMRWRLAKCRSSISL